MFYPFHFLAYIHFTFRKRIRAIKIGFRWQYCYFIQVGDIWVNFITTFTSFSHSYFIKACVCLTAKLNFLNACVRFYPSTRPKECYAVLSHVCLSIYLLHFHLVKVILKVDIHCKKTYFGAYKNPIEVTTKLILDFYSILYREIPRNIPRNELLSP